MSDEQLRYEEEKYHYEMDLIDHYEQSGLISDPTKCFRSCEWCDRKFHPDELTDVDVKDSGGRIETVEVCDQCLDLDESEE